MIESGLFSNGEEQTNCLVRISISKKTNYYITNGPKVKFASFSKTELYAGKSSKTVRYFLDNYLTVINRQIRG